MIPAFESPVAYKVIYVFAIHDDDHKGFLKIGETTLKTDASPSQLPPNCNLLNDAARKRIDQYTKTALVRYDLLHTELAERKVILADGSIRDALFSDNDVQMVLDNSGFLCKKFYDNGKKSEWYQVDLNTAVKAIKAVKEGRAVLAENEKSKTDVSVVHAPKIILRDEQNDAIRKTMDVFRSKDSMLWNCKMRFGKTITTCEMAKRAGFQKTIVVTHRPVVVEGWEKDFHLIFGNDSDYTFLSKVKGGTEVDFDEHIDAENNHALRNMAASGKPFFYFASVQDLRGSIRAGGKFNKKRCCV